MVKREHIFKFDSKTGLFVEFASENLGLKVIGWSNNNSELQVKFELLEAEREIKLEDIIKFDYDKDQNRLKIKTGELKDVGNLNIRLELKVPYVSSVDLQTVNGPIAIEGLQGNQKLSTENGPIKVMECDGDFDVQLKNGPLKIKSCNGRFKLKGQNGPIKLVECNGNLDLQIVNGPVRVLESEFEQAIIKSKNGGIYYEFSPIEKGNFNFVNKNGKIHLVIPDDIEYALEARNAMGKFHIGLGGEYERFTEGDVHVVKMIHSSGNVDINVNNEFGGICLVNTKGKSTDFDFSFVGDILDDVFSGLYGEHMEKAKAGFEKAKVKFKGFKMPDVGKIVSDAMANVQDEVKDVWGEVCPENVRKDTEQKFKESMAKVKEKIREKMESRKLNEEEEEQVKERSRLKILQMLEEGKITADEAERLFKAMEENHGR